METFASRLVFDGLVESDNPERLPRFIILLVGAGKGDCPGSLKERLPLVFLAVFF